jgi:hypothetical protein
VEVHGRERSLEVQRRHTEAGQREVERMHEKSSEWKKERK